MSVSIWFRRREVAWIYILIFHRHGVRRIRRGGNYGAGRQRLRPTTPEKAKSCYPLPNETNEFGNMIRSHARAHDRALVIRGVVVRCFALRGFDIVADGESSQGRCLNILFSAIVRTGFLKVCRDTYRSGSMMAR